MAITMRTRLGADGHDYPYTHEDLVFDDNGVSMGQKLESINDTIDDKITLATNELKQSNYNLLNNGKFENCYVDTENMIPSWICEDSLRVRIPQEVSPTGCLELLNYSDTTKVVKQRVVFELEKTYTLTFKASWQDNVNGGVQARVDFYNVYGDHIASLTVPVVNNELELQTLTFPTPALYKYSYSEVKFLIGDTYGSGEYTTARIGEVKLEEGDIYTGWRGSKKDETITIEGPNLVKNGDFSSFALPKTLTDWTIEGDGGIWDYNGQENYNKPGCIYFRHTALDDTYSGFYQDVYNLKKRTEYTLTFDIDWEPNVREFYAHLAFYDKDSNRMGQIDLKPDRAGTYSYTFVIPDIDFRNITIGFYHKGVKEDTGGAFLGIAGNVKLVEKVLIEDLGTVLSKYTTKTEFDQTNEDFAFRLSQTGGGNLLKNSKFKDGSHYWNLWHWSDNVAYYNSRVQEPWSDWNNEAERSLRIEAGVNDASVGAPIRAGVVTEPIPVKGNTTYSFTCFTDSHRAGKIYIEFYQSNDGEAYSYGTTLADITPKWHSQWNTSYTEWNKVSVTFTTSPYAKYVDLRFYMDNYTGDQVNKSACMWIALPCLVEGSTPTNWQPNSDELYDGIVKIDAGGIEVQQDSNESVVLDREALKFYEGDELYSKIDGGLFKIMKPGDSSSTIGSIGRFEWEYTGTCCTCVGAGLGHDVALGSVRDSSGTTICNIVDTSQGGFLTGASWYYDPGLNINQAYCRTLHFKGDKSATFASQVETNVAALSIWGSNPSHNNSEGLTANTGYIYSRDTLNFGIAYGQLKVAMEICETSETSNNTRVHMYGPLNMHGYDITNAGWTNPVSASSEYTSRLLREGSIENNNYGTLSYYDGELRWCWRETVFTYPECDIDPETDEWVYTGRNICYVELPIFMAESIEADYHISVGKIGWGDYRILEKNQYYFILESQEEDFAFTFEVVAKLVDGQTLNNNVSIASMSTTANPAISVEPPTTEEIILQGN